MINESTTKAVLTASIVNILLSGGPIDEFMLVESLGIQCNPKCGNCKCGSCPIGGKPYSLKEERELKLIENNLEFHGQYWIAGYPWVKNPSLLPNNFEYAMKRLVSTETSLCRDPIWMSTYSEQIEDMILRGVARKLTSEEINTYDGPIHYIAHHAVIKPDSKSTPVRIVFDSSHSYKGHPLNSYWAKGPDGYMNNLLSVLLKFRENRIGIVGT